MAASPSTATHGRAPSVSSTSLRSGARQASSGAPRTPQRHGQGLSHFTSSMSPGPGTRHEEDAIIVEMGSRWLRAGFEGDSVPVCTVGFGREEGRRVGDYRGWIKSDKSSIKTFSEDVEKWSKDHELWGMDIRDIDIGLVEDKIERAFRDIYNKYILADAGSARLVLVLPSIVPHPLLSALLSTLFQRWRYPSIMLLPSAAMAAVAAGVRSALVVDIGWEETVVTGIYEYREVKAKRSTRATKCLMQQMGKFLSEIIREKSASDGAQSNETIAVDFEQCEEITTRMSWCRKHSKRDQSSDAGDDHHETQFENDLTDKFIPLTLPTEKGPIETDMPFSKFADIVDSSLFGAGIDAKDWDDEDMPLDVLIYNTLLPLSPDVRGVCMSRIIFVGGGANISGIRQRVLNDLEVLVKNLKWKVAKGKVIDKQERERQHRQASTNGSATELNGKGDAMPEPEPNFIDEKLKRDDKDAKPSVKGVIRAVESLGPWPGASLVTSLKVRGLVEVEREKFLQHGLAGASRDGDMHAVLDRRSGYGASMVRPSGERASWTLGEWG